MKTPEEIPYSEYALFQIALRGYTVYDLLGKEVPKYILWDKIKDSEMEIILAKDKKLPEYHFLRRKHDNAH